MKPYQPKNNQKHQKKKGGIQGTKWKDPNLRKQKKITKEGEPQGEHQVPKPPLVARSISNKEREGLLERTLNLKKTFTYCNMPFQNRDYCDRSNLTIVTLLEPSTIGNLAGEQQPNEKRCLVNISSIYGGVGCGCCFRVYGLIYSKA